jgi:hypothetical protein
MKEKLKNNKTATQWVAAVFSDNIKKGKKQLDLMRSISYPSYSFWIDRVRETKKFI